MLREPLKVSSNRYALALLRIKLRILIGLHTGHTYLNRHLYIMKINDDELFPLCQEEDESPERYLRSTLIELC